MSFQKLKPWLVMGLIFVVGMVTGASLMIGMGPHFRHPPGEREMKNHWMMMLVHRLNLTDDQQAKIQPILTDAENQIHSVHGEEIGRISKIMETANSQISSLLTPDQQTEMKKLESEREKMFSGHMGGRRGPGARDDRDGPPHGGPGEGMKPPLPMATNAAPQGA